MSLKSDCCSDHTPEYAAAPIVYACSGASDVGEIADRAARRLHALKRARMECLPSVSARTVRRDELAKAPLILAIEGCGKECVSKLLELAGIRAVTQVRLCDLGMIKGETTPGEAAVANAVAHCQTLIDRR